MTAVPDDIRAYHDRLDPEARPICDLLLAEIERGLPDADRKVWHAHPVWFFDGNPVVGYDRLKNSVRLLFWSGRAFPTLGLSPEGTFQAAEARFSSPDEVDLDLLARWLSESRDYQWNYRDIRRNRGLVPLIGVEA